MTNETTRIVLASRPDGAPTHENFRIETAPLPEPSEGEVVVRTIYQSLDPYMRGRMNPGKSYAPRVEIDAVMEAGTVGEVVESRDPSLEVGDIVLGRNGWQTHAVADAARLRKLDPAAAPISTALGVLGMPGFTAYSGLLEIGKPQPGETVAVAAAAGPVGSAVGQIARLKGARAIGIAGGEEKVRWLRDVAGFDVALDHRSPSFREELKAAAPDGIDVYFENVGGHVWDAVLPRLNSFARVPVCGLVAHYNETELPPGPDRSVHLMRSILFKSLTVRGFFQMEFLDRLHEPFLDEAAEWVRDGSLVYREDVVDGLENAPEAFLGLLRGANFGKLLVKVGDDPTRPTERAGA